MRGKRLVSLGLAWLLLFAMAGCSPTPPGGERGLGNGWQPQRRMALQYATGFSVD